MMFWKLLIFVLVGLMILGIAVVATNSMRLDRANQRLAQDLLDEAKAKPGRYAPEDLEELPDPVANYLQAVLTPGRPYVSTVRLEQSGDFYLQNSWRPFTATQHFTTSPPGFVWDAHIQIIPLVNARVVDRYSQGEGALHAKVFGTLTVADVGSSPEIDSGELMRYLAETAWFPTVLLPGNGITWQAIDERSAEATLLHDDTSASLVFYFNDRHELERVEGRRYAVTDDGMELRTWIGRFWNYAEQGGMRIPLNGEVSWLLPEGEQPYWRGRIDGIAFSQGTEEVYDIRGQEAALAEP